MIPECNKILRYSKEPTLMNKEVQKIIQPLSKKFGFENTDILKNWEIIVGGDLAKGLRPVKIDFPHNMHKNGTLTIKAYGGAFALLCNHQKPRIIEKVNAYFGYPAINKIKIMQSGFLKSPLKIPAQTPPSLSFKDMHKLQDSTHNIQDEELKNLLYSLGRSVLKKK